MTRNTSSAVMNQRHVQKDGLDDFPTPPWATRALCERLRDMAAIERQAVWEPACNRGYMARPLGEAFGRVIATDIKDYGWDGQQGVCDFLMADGRAPGDRPDWIITNPPFRLALDFVRVAISHAEIGVAMFVPPNFPEGIERHHVLFGTLRPSLVLVFAERVSIWEGVMLDPDIPIQNPRTGKVDRPSTATSYSWIIWRVDRLTNACELDGIPPCRKRLTRQGDYPPVPDHLRVPVADAPLLGDHG